MSNEANANDDVLRVIKALRRGEENAKTRRALKFEIGLEDRTLRDLIALARASGYPIISSSKGAGYYLPGFGEQGINESQRFIAEQNSRTERLKESMIGVKKYLQENGGLR